VKHPKGGDHHQIDARSPSGNARASLRFGKKPAAVPRGAGAHTTVGMVAIVREFSTFMGHSNVRNYSLWILTLEPAAGVREAMTPALHSSCSNVRVMVGFIRRF
jgi:hypothetical protein